MELRNTLEVPLMPDRAWDVLLDVPRMVRCLPGARLTEDCGNGRCLGEVRVRLGPVALTFVGSTQLLEADAKGRTARLKAEGRDAKGRGGAAADMRFAVLPTAAGSQVVVETQLTLSGAVAQYGRGASMIRDVANLMVSGFADNLRVELTRTSAPSSAAPGKAPETGVTPAGPLNAVTLAIILIGRAFVRLFRRLVGRRT